MSVIIHKGHLFTRIRIAIFAQMWAIILADVLAHHAAAELPLAFLVEQPPIDANEYLAAAHGVVGSDERVVVARQ